MWKQACVVLAMAAVASSYFTPYTFPQVVYSHPHVRAGQDQKYDCPREGFFVNPMNCSQFYRCVDYTGTGYVYSVYAFECPRFHVFILDGDNSTCVPGTTCVQGPQTAQHVPSSTTQEPRPTDWNAPWNTGTTRPPTTTRPTYPTTRPPTRPTPWVTDTAATTPPPSSGSGGSSGGGYYPIPVRPTTQTPPTPSPTYPPTRPPTRPTTSRPVNNPMPASTPGPAVMDCRGQYVQHDSFCNVYYKCDYEADKFLCPAGSVFDTVRQMCRIQAADEDLCGGKSIYSTSFRAAYNIPLGNIGERTHLPNVSPQYIIPQSQPNYLAYFDPSHPLRIKQAQVPQQYVQPIATRFTQPFFSHPEPQAVQYRPIVVDGDRSTFQQPQSENVHPRQYYRQPQPEYEVDNPRAAFRIYDVASQSRPEYEVDNPRHAFRIFDETNQPQVLGKYYRMIDEEQQVQETVHPREYYVPIDSDLEGDAREFY